MQDRFHLQEEKITHIPIIIILIKNPNKIKKNLNA